MFWFIVLLLVAGAGFYFYQKLTTIEREIRAEQEAEKQRSNPSRTEEIIAAEPVVTPAEEPILTAVDRDPTVLETPVPDEGLTTEDEILVAVKNLPGIKQTELYESFADVDKKKFQQTVKKLADDGGLRREKQGSSYILFPA